jgi:hypothetical protein
MVGFAGLAERAWMKRKLVGTAAALALIAAWLAPAALANSGTNDRGCERSGRHHCG